MQFLVEPSKVIGDEHRAAHRVDQHTYTQARAVAHLPVPGASTLKHRRVPMGRQRLERLSFFGERFIDPPPRGAVYAPVRHRLAPLLDYESQ